jgi:hypothetical protein
MNQGDRRSPANRNWLCAVEALRRFSPRPAA